jgi:hypothetical protein
MGPFQAAGETVPVVSKENDAFPSMTLLPHLLKSGCFKNKGVINNSCKPRIRRIFHQVRELIDTVRKDASDLAL